MKSYLVLVVLLVISIGAPVYSQELRLSSNFIAHSLPMHVALENGYLKEEGIKAQVQRMVGQPAISAMIGGSLDAGESAYVTIFLARDAGVDAAIVFPFSRHTKERDPDALMVTAGSAIRGARDLEGKAVALVTRRSMAWLNFVEWIALRGADPNKVQVVELPFPQMVPQLRAGTIQAAAVTEPFVSAEMEQGGVRIVERHSTTMYPQNQVEVTGLVATEKWLKANRALAERLTRALRKGTDYVNANPNSWAKILATYTQIKPEMVKKIIMPVWYYPIDLAGLQVQSDLALKWGLVKKKQNVGDFVWPTALK